MNFDSEIIPGPFPRQSDDAILSGAIADLDAARARLTPREPVRVSRALPAAERILAAPVASEADVARDAEESLRASRLADYVRQRGRRYAECTLDNFATGDNRDKAAAVKLLCDYLDDFAGYARQGCGLTLYGPVGTGKDHLAAAACLHAIRAGKRVEWVDGMSLYADLRRSFDAKSRETESGIISRYERAQVLCISDPIPVSGELTDFQAGALFRIVDGRYSDMLPTIVTVNVSGKEDAARRLTPAIYDRLRGSSLAIHCNWPSHRTPNRRQP